MSRSSPSRQSSFSYNETPSRRSSVASNPNVFSDDYALEPVDTRLDFEMPDLFQTPDPLADQNRTPDTSTIAPYPAVPSRLSLLNRPNSISKRPLAQDSLFTTHDRAPERAMSTSSRFSFVRSQSPYSGPTQPSHPYAMYPQITRASSIASESTIRPRESPFVPTGGPEHPYSLYPQNTVLGDDEDEDIGTQAIPLGFPRLGLSVPTSSGGSGSDVGDIVGSDGHIEQLPPYTRYADNCVAKGDMANISDASTLAPSRRASRRSALAPSVAPSEPLEIQEESSDREILLNEKVLKENWKDKARKRVCGGIALWLLILIVALVVFAGVIGGVIGGVVGRRQGTDSAIQAGATTTVWLDAEPATTNNDTPACPTGRYNIPFNQTQEVNNCVVDQDYTKAWGCLEIAYLGITISETVVAGNRTLQVAFDDYSVDASTYLYGPQPPDFNGTTFDLKPYKDKDDQQYGIALFFAEQFNKLSILPGNVIKPYKRSVDERDIYARGQSWDGTPLSIGDEPWFCFWNATINEFWIFLTQPAAPISFSSFSTVTAAPSSPYSQSAVWPVTSGGSSTKWSNFAEPTQSVEKRNNYKTPYLPQYPKLVKMIEKRLPEGNVQPYCQRMQVLNDWQIVPRQDGQIVMIQESQYDQNPVTTGSNKRWRRDTTTELQSNCVCEWMSI